MKNIFKFINRDVTVGDTVCKMKSVLLTIVCVGIFAVLAHASTNFNVLDVSPGTAGINWTPPYMTSEIQIQEIVNGTTVGGNWTQLSFFDTCAGQTLNWTNLYTILPGGSWKMNDAVSHCDTIAIRGQNNGQVDQIYYRSQDPND